MDLKNDCLEAYSAVARSACSASDSISKISTGRTRCLSDLVNLLPPREHAELALVLAYATVTLFGVNLRCSGTDEKRHPLERERERLMTYIAKFVSVRTDRKRRLGLNVDAVQRNVKHHLDV